jgi:hypothetical protein
MLTKMVLGVDAHHRQRDNRRHTSNLRCPNQEPAGPAAVAPAAEARHEQGQRESGRDATAIVPDRSLRVSAGIAQVAEPIVEWGKVTRKQSPGYGSAPEIGHNSSKSAHTGERHSATLAGPPWAGQIDEVLQQPLREPQQSYEAIIHPKSDTRRIARFAAIVVSMLLLAAVLWHFLDR